MCYNWFSFSQYGNYFVQNYLPNEYQEAANNFGITQNNNGIIFIANNNGVLIYDGITWDQCKRQDEITIFSIGKTNTGEIVVGTSDGDVARIKQNAKGKFVYTSLLNSIPIEDRPYEPIRQILNLGESTFFISEDKLIEYANDSIILYQPENYFHARAFIMGSHLFISDVSKGICCLKSGQLVPIKGTEALSEEKFFYCYPLGKIRFALGFRGIGTVLFDYNSKEPLESKFQNSPSECDQEIIEAEANNGLLLNNGNYIVCTNKKGAFEINKQLKIISRINSGKGILDNNCKSAFQDINGNLWLALYYGVSFVEINSRLFQYSRKNGVAGPVQSACYFSSKLMIANDKGVQYYDEIEDRFKFLDGLDKQTWHLLPFENKLYIGTDKGLYVYGKNGLHQMTSNRTFCLFQNPIQKGILYAGTEDGIEIHRITQNGTALIKMFELNTSIKTIASDSEKNVFFASVDKGIFYLNSSNLFRLDSLQEKEGLPHQNYENTVFNYNANVFLGTDEGIYVVKKNKDNRFEANKKHLLWEQTKGTEIFRSAQVSHDLVCSRGVFYAFKNKKRR